jgi:hypothetical protein
VDVPHHEVCIRSSNYYVLNNSHPEADSLWPSWMRISIGIWHGVPLVLTPISDSFGEITWASRIAQMWSSAALRFAAKTALIRSKFSLAGRRKGASVAIDARVGQFSPSTAGIYSSSEPTIGGDAG